MSKGFFITGTDTGVGKTIITASLIKAINFLGKKVGGMKPIETGCLKEGNVFIPSDGMFIKTMAHMEEKITQISPCCFENPLAPLPASEIEGIPVDLEKIRREYGNLAKKYHALVVEGIGGLLVPIRKDYFVLNLAKEFGLPLIIVARLSLGTINHTLLTLNCASREGLQVAGIILNNHRPPEYSLAEKTNPEVISKISSFPIIGIFPYLKDFESNTLEKMAVKYFNLDIIESYL